MAFYVATNGVLHLHDFRYLHGDFEKARLERTLISGTHKKDIPEKNKDFFAIDVMSHHVRTITFETHLNEVKEIMTKENIRHLPVLKNHKFIGMVSDRDLLKMDLSGTFSFLKVEEIMTSLVVVADEETPLAHIARVFLEEKISAIPIINTDNKLSGIVTISDILKTVIYNRLVLK